MFHYIVKPYLINKAGGFVLGKLLNGVGLVHMRISPNGWTSDLRTGIVFRTTEAAYALAPLNEIPANLIQRPCAIFQGDKMRKLFLIVLTISQLELLKEITDIAIIAIKPLSDRSYLALKEKKKSYKKQLKQLKEKGKK